MSHLRFLIYVIGIFSSGLSFAQEAASSDEFSGKPGMVVVEPTNVSVTSAEGEYALVPYRERRNKWGFTAAVGYSSYQPENYEPDFVADNFDSIYSSDDMPMIELRFTAKRNLSIGSIGAEFAIGFYENSSDVDDNIIDSKLKLTPIYLGGVFNLDALSSEPRFVPYVSAGAYIMMYDEQTETASFSGQTTLAPYVTGGVAFQIDWLDRRNARIAYEDSSIQASYIYAQAAKLFEAGGETDPDFENSISWGAGMKVEF